MRYTFLQTLTHLAFVACFGVLAQSAQAQSAIGQSELEIAPAVADMKSLVEQGRFVDAFNLGLKNEQLAGDPLYDYYFGISAVDSGRASLGVLALERVLLTNPQNDLARLELARGYFVLEDYERAKEEFTILLGKQLPPPVRASIEKYLLAIRDKDPDFRTVFKGYAEYTIGHNSNVNSSADTLVPVPYSFAQSVTDPIPTKAQSTALSQLAVGINAQGPIIPGLKYLAAVDANHRQHASIDGYDQAAIGLTGGVEFAGEKEKYRLIAFYSDAYFNDDKLRDVTGVAVDWTRPLDKETAIRSAIAYSQLRYDASKDRDGNLANFTFGVSRYLGGAWKSSVDVDITLGQERNQSNNPDLSRDIFGARVSWGFYPGGKWQGSVVASYTNSDYKGPEPVAPTADTYKQDEFVSVELALQYQLTKGWSVRGEYIRNENISNVTAYEFSQDVFLLKMRYEWK